jgi:uncharacterized protein (DUF362 family)
MKNTLSRREALRWLALAAASSLVACQTAQDPTQAVVQPADIKPTMASTPTAMPLPTAAPRVDFTATPTGAVPAADPQATPTSQPVAIASGETYLSVIRGQDPAAITEAALKSLGGMERFVKNGYDVIIKPNICVDSNTFEYAATTNPVVVATLVRLALGAGAKRVRVMDLPFGGTAASAYAKSGIADAVKTAGGEMEVMNPNKFRKTSIPDGKSLKEAMIYQDILDCDLLIDVPTAKHHSLARITVGSKNLMGVIRDRGAIHSDLAQRIPDLVSLLRPQLTVVDAVRTLMAHGPTGGNLNDVKINNTVIASHDIIAADSYATQLFNMTGADIPYLAAAAARGLGKIDLTGLKIEEVNL